MPLIAEQYFEEELHQSAKNVNYPMLFNGKVTGVVVGHQQGSSVRPRAHTNSFGPPPLLCIFWQVSQDRSLS